MEHIALGIPVHAEPERLRATLASVRAHTPPPFDLLLLPDGPDAETRAALATLADVAQSGTADPQGTAACFNRLAATGADLLVLLESGAQVTPGWLDALRAALDTDAGYGLAGPSTNRSWNAQQITDPLMEDTPAAIAATAREVAQRYGDMVHTLEPLHSLAEFCYVVRREVVAAIGSADVGYGRGPCWEMDYNIRAARAGFRGVWACGAYVHRAPFTTRRQHDEIALFETNKHRYQDHFCGMRLRGETTTYQPHCRGEDCPHFAPHDLIRVVGDIPNAGLRPEAPPAPALLPARFVPSTDDAPLISCIMPTRDRRAFVPRAIRYFQRQTYPRRELIVVDDGIDRVDDLMPTDDPRIRYVALPTPLSIGAKRNAAVTHARGTIIAHWDDDDWYGPERLERQIAPLLAGSADLTGLHTEFTLDVTTWRAWTCSAELHRRLFVGDIHGGTLVYWRWVWQQLAHYRPLSLAEDALFLREAMRGGARLEKVAHTGVFVYVRHGTNAWAFPAGSYLDPAGWQPVAADAVLPDADRAFYATLATNTGAVKPPAPDTLVGAIVPVRGAREETDAPLPLVSCIMPTYDRAAFIPQAIQYFQRQDYPHRELIVLDDGPGDVEALLPPDPRIRYVRLPTRLVLGEKRNRACALARGTIIAHWDDDDWIAPHRLSAQVAVLTARQADLCGVSRAWYYEPTTDRAWWYEFPSARPWLAGNSLCFRAAFWERNPFPAIPVGEDTRFCWSPAATRRAVVNDSSICVGLVHRGNTSLKAVTGPFWHPQPITAIHALLGADRAFYETLR